MKWNEIFHIDVQGGRSICQRTIKQHLFVLCFNLSSNYLLFFSRQASQPRMLGRLLRELIRSKDGGIPLEAGRRRKMHLLPRKPKKTISHGLKMMPYMDSLIKVTILSSLRIYCLLTTFKKWPWNIFRYIISCDILRYLYMHLYMWHVKLFWKTALVSCVCLF